jgi:hypothetical protein
LFDGIREVEVLEHLVGDWYGLFASGWDRTNVGEAALRVDSQERHCPLVAVSTP